VAAKASAILPLARFIFIADCGSRIDGGSNFRAEGIKEKGPLRASDIANDVGLHEEYKALNKVCSKLVHSTGWSVLAMKVGEDKYPQIRDTVFGCGVGSLAQIYMEIYDYNGSQGMKPNA
jgi:hypothetical protein